ncbi:MAG: bifunctional methylenetetrahydrofolate dehydrogenase/methenyltetrahydrofolate cyclohydrolase, partial [Patescibacteria group bacterium]|nr:bifunctional methylenetetrahydrofolate dehydrogenase/methenyltetrahydrofolate cyclohydrolase [Patescibacteria group bacterium]
MVSILADESKETHLYASIKEKFAQKIGVIYEIHHFENSKTKEIIEDVKRANNDLFVHGIMVQLPIPHEEEILSMIEPSKDVDCLTPENV